MQAWCLEHPWMTFFLVLAALEAMGQVGVAWSRRNYWKQPDKE